MGYAARLLRLLRSLAMTAATHPTIGTLTMRLRYFLFSFALLGLLGFSWPFSFLFSQPNHESFGTSSWLQKQMQIVKSQAGNLNDQVLRLSLLAFMHARQQGVVTKPLLTVIDYSKPSTEKRLWVFDLNRGKMLFNTWVSHGKNSGGVNATSFSNQPGSLKSSMGVFVTDDTPYMGGNGYSLRIKGLEHGINDKAYQRDIVFHGAWYVDPAVGRRYGQIGRSWGCPAVSENTIKPLIETIRNHSVVFMYYPDQHWLRHSHFLASV